MSRVNYEIPDLLAGIPGSPDEVGYDISLSKIYDDIKDARFEEDGSVSFGIWERELKKADWDLVEQLTVDALKDKSKDFQIVGWLAEALVVLDGFDGMIRSMQILNEFTKTFWSTGYPRKEDNSSDSEQKVRIIEWIFDIVEKKSKFVPFAWFNGNDFVNLYDYEYALELKNTVIRSPNSANEILDTAKRTGRRTLEEVLNMINITPQTGVDETLDAIESIRGLKAVFDETLQELTGESFNSFSSLIANLEKIERLLTQRKIEQSQSTEEKHENGEISMIPNKDPKLRDEIYDQISELSQKLAVIEKHSPSSFILNLVVSWRDKSLLEIMDDLKSGNSEAHRLLKFLIN